MCSDVRAGHRQFVFERLLHRNAIRRAIGLPALNVPRLYLEKIVQAEHRSRLEQTNCGRKLCMTNRQIPSQADLEPTNAEREIIIAKLVSQNLDRAERGLPEREVQEYAELGFAKHRAQAYQVLLKPYLEAALKDIEPDQFGRTAAPSDYRQAVKMAQEQLSVATGIVSPSRRMKPDVLELIGHQPARGAPATDAGNHGVCDNN